MAKLGVFLMIMTERIEGGEVGAAVSDMASGPMWCAVISFIISLNFIFTRKMLA